MPTLPFRSLSTRGILRDPSPYDLTPDAWSGGSNVFFANTKAQRAPIYREVSAALPASPIFIAGRRPEDGYDSVFIVGADGSINAYKSDTFTVVSPATVTWGAAEQQLTTAFLGDVTYINHPSEGPLYYGPASSQFAVLPGWDPTWSCRVLRPFMDYLVAFDVTKGAVQTSSMVKWSNLALAGAPPASWNADDPTTNAGENILASLDSPIMDAAVLADVMVIYSQRQVWAMTPTTDQSIFTFAQLFGDGGAIAPNCVVSVDHKHYVFGPNDIIVHDGNVKQSLLANRNHEYIYRNLNAKLANRCFALHMPRFNSILFGYVSGDSDAAFKAPTACNKAAIYNYVNDTWTFGDLPNVPSMTTVNVDDYMLYEQAGARTYDGTGGTYYDQTDGYIQHVVAASQTLGTQLTANRLLGYDYMDKGDLAYQFCPEANGPSYLERTGIDLDEIQAGLSSYKAVTRIYPQVDMFRNVPVEVQVGSSMTPAGSVTWDAAISFDPTQSYKVDTRRGGRYLALRYTVAGAADFEVTGFDADVSSRGNR